MLNTLIALALGLPLAFRLTALSEAGKKSLGIRLARLRLLFDNLFLGFSGFGAETLSERSLSAISSLPPASSTLPKLTRMPCSVSGRSILIEANSMSAIHAATYTAAAMAPARLPLFSSGS